MELKLKQLKQSTARNPHRFPADFMFEFISERIAIFSFTIVSRKELKVTWSCGALDSCCHASIKMTTIATQFVKKISEIANEFRRNPWS
jgi:hypothetical protein